MTRYALAVLMVNIGCASAHAQFNGGDARVDKLVADLAASKKSAASDVPASPDLRGELLKMKEIDQSSREAWIATGLKDEKLAQRILDIDGTDTRRLREIVDKVG